MTNTTHTPQMDLGLIARPAGRPILRRQRRLPGAHWWFTQMRQAVANAPEWRSEPLAARQSHPSPLWEEGRGELSVSGPLNTVN